MKKQDKILNLILPIISIACMMLLWTAGAIVADNKYILPSVMQTLNEFFGLFASTKFYLALAFTFVRSAIAFSLSFLISAVLAYLSSRVKFAEKVILPIISVIRALPTLAIILLLLFWTNNQVAPVVVTMLVVMPTSYTSLKNALDGVDKTSIEAAKVDGADKKHLFFLIELPQLSPSLLNVVGGGLSLNLKLMVAAEVMSATAKSLGTMLNISSYNAEIANMLALVLVVLILGLVIEFLFNTLSKKAGSWR